MRLRKIFIYVELHIYFLSFKIHSTLYSTSHAVWKIC